MQRLLNILNEFWSGIVQIATFIILYLTPISNYIHIVLVLIAIDLITGSYASWKEGEKFQAKKLRKTVEKFIFYGLAIIVGLLLQALTNNETEIARIAAIAVSSIEAKSIYENISRILGIDMLAAIWNLLKEKLDTYIATLKSPKNDTQE